MKAAEEEAGRCDGGPAGQPTDQRFRWLMRTVTEARCNSDETAVHTSNYIEVPHSWPENAIGHSGLMIGNL
jgi:hypothetical protein